MTSQPTSGPGSGVIASKLTTITSAQLKALFTTAIAVSPTPRSDEIIVPLWWAATAEDSDTFYDNGPGGALSIGYVAGNAISGLADLLSGLTAGDVSFVRQKPTDASARPVAEAAGSPVVMYMDTGNLTSGDFPIAFTLFYVIIPS